MNEASKSIVKLPITLYKREYVINCGPGEESRLLDLAKLVQQEMEAVAHNVGNATEPRHLMLTCLSLADKLFEARAHMSESLDKQEDLFVAAVDHLKERVAALASQVGRA